MPITSLGDSTRENSIKIKLKTGKKAPMILT